MADEITRPTRTVDNPKFGQPGEFPRIEQQAVTVDDLIAELQAIRAKHGNIAVVRTGFEQYLDENSTELAILGRVDDGVFEVREADEVRRDRDLRCALEGWAIPGPVLEVRVDI